MSKIHFDRCYNMWKIRWIQWWYPFCLKPSKMASFWRFCFLSFFAFLHFFIFWGRRHEALAFKYIKFITINNYFYYYYYHYNNNNNNNYYYYYLIASRIPPGQVKGKSGLKECWAVVQMSCNQGTRNPVTLLPCSPPTLQPTNPETHQPCDPPTLKSIIPATHQPCNPAANQLSNPTT